jgi:hypothetical protein
VERETELDAPSFKHPVCNVFATILATSPLANLEWRDAAPSFTQMLAHPRLKIGYFPLPPRSAAKRVDLEGRISATI